jgi:hypothetical protein
MEKSPRLLLAPQGKGQLWIRFSGKSRNKHLQEDRAFILTAEDLAEGDTDRRVC